MLATNKLALASQVLFAGVIALCTGFLVYSLPEYTQTYPDFIVGSIAWRASTKTKDYYLLVSILSTFLLASWFYKWLFTGLEARVAESDLRRLHQLSMYAVAPAVLMAGTFLTTQSTGLNLLTLSATLLAVVGVLLLGLRTGIRSGLTSSELIDVVHSTVWIGLFITFAVGLMDYANWGGFSPWALTDLPLLLLLLPSIAGLSLLPASVEKRSKIRAWALLISQLPLPFLAMVILPPIYTDYASIRNAELLTAPIWGALGLIIACAYAEQIIRYRRRFRSATEVSPLLNWSSLILVSLAYHTNADWLPTVGIDDYHLGEFLTPWASLWDFGLLPFWDAVPARGLYNYLSGMLNEILFDGSAATMSFTKPLLYLVLTCIVVAALKHALRKELVFLILLFLPFINNLSEILMVVGAFLCAAITLTARLKFPEWLLFCLLAGTSAVLFAPGQASLVILSLIPVGLLVLHRDYFEGLQIRSMTLAVFVVFVVITAVTPLWQVVFGAIRYGIEQSSVNSVAHGIQWLNSFGYGELNPWQTEFIRTSWILVGTIAAALVANAGKSKGLLTRRNLLTLTIFLVCLLFVFRSAGRINAGFTRLGFMSAWSVTMLLPLVLFGYRRQLPAGGAVLLWSFLVGISASPLQKPDYFALTKPFVAKQRLVRLSPDQHESMMKAREALPTYGYARPNAEHLERLTTTKAHLDALLEPEETYLDATNRGAQYFFFERAQPIESAAVYNLVSRGAQERSVERLKLNQPPAVLLASENKSWDGGGIALRSYALYRHLLLDSGYILVTVDKQLWLINAERAEERLNELAMTGGIVITDPLERLILLDSVVTSKSLRRIPTAWGRSWDSLRPKVVQVARLGPEYIESTNQVKSAADGVWAVTGGDSFLRFDLREMNLTGQDAGLVVFDFQCLKPAGAVSEIEIHWRSDLQNEGVLNSLRFTADGSGRKVVPIDAFPGWLMASELSVLRIDIGRGSINCNEFRLGEIELYDRVPENQTESANSD